MSENRGIKRSSIPFILRGKSKRKNHEAARQENYLEVLVTKELVKTGQMHGLPKREIRKEVIVNC